MITRLVGWIREGYPTGVPSHDYMPLIALLRRRLSDDEVREICHELLASGMIPADRIDIAVEITKLTDELPTPADVARVRDRLRAKGWPVEFEEDDDRDGYPT